MLLLLEFKWIKKCGVSFNGNYTQLPITGDGKSDAMHLQVGQIHLIKESVVCPPRSLGDVSCLCFPTHRTRPVPRRPWKTAVRLSTLPLR